MYQVTNIKTNAIKTFKDIRSAMRWKDRQDNNYGAVCTTYPKSIM